MVGDWQVRKVGVHLVFPIHRECHRQHSRPFISLVFNQSTVDQPCYPHFKYICSGKNRAWHNKMKNSTATASTHFRSHNSSFSIYFPQYIIDKLFCSWSRVESSASDVSLFSMDPFKTVFTFKTDFQFFHYIHLFSIKNAWALSTSATVSHNNLHCLHVQCHLPSILG